MRDPLRFSLLKKEEKGSILLQNPRKREVFPMANPEKDTQAIYDARSLGTAKTLVLGVQHLFAMFGATVLVPAITGLNVSTTLLFAGLGTLLFHLITGRKVPAFLGSSFAFLGGYAAKRC